MSRRLVFGCLLAGWSILGLANSAGGQVILESALEDVVADDDRYGGYESANGSQDGPVLLAQIEEWVQPPGQTTPSPNLNLAPAQPLPAPALVPISPVSPPVMSGPPIIDYGPAMAPSPMPARNCPPWRPCGPKESFGSNWLVMQGFAGADFRGACDFHDQCLMNPCNNRKMCDKMFLAYLDNACNCSSFPILCRIKAREYYVGVRLFGWIY